MIIEYLKIGDVHKDGHYEVTLENHPTKGSVEYVSEVERFCPHCGAPWSEGYTKRERDG